LFLDANNELPYFFCEDFNDVSFWARLASHLDGKFQVIAFDVGVVLQWEAEHFQHVFNLLAPGGQLIADQANHMLVHFQPNETSIFEQNLVTRLENHLQEHKEFAIKIPLEGPQGEFDVHKNTILDFIRNFNRQLLEETGFQVEFQEGFYLENAGIEGGRSLSPQRYIVATKPS